MTAPAPEKAAPIPAERLAFGDAVTNIAASEENPIKHGWFIRRGKRSGRVNAGAFVEYVTADGRLHQTPPDNVAPRDAEPAFRADRDSQEGRIREDERDAERYRYLRDNCVRKWRSNIGAPDSLSIDYDADGHDLNAALDASLARLRGDAS